MHKKKFLITISFFLFLMTVTSLIKTETRMLEKNILTLKSEIFQNKQNLHEAQIEYTYLTSPKMISEKAKNYINEDYKSIKFSNIYLNFEKYKNIHNKTSDKNINEKKIQKK